MIKPSLLLICCALAGCLLWPQCGLGETVIGIVQDGPQPRPFLHIDRLEAEIRGLAGQEFDIAMPEDKQLHGGWTLAGVRGALDTLLDDDEVDLVITLGLTATNEAAKIDTLEKPVIGTIVADVELQDLPTERIAEKIVSGKPNFVYIARVQVSDLDGETIEQTNIDEAVGIFRDAVEFEHLAILIDRLTIDSIPRLASGKREDIATRLGVRTTLVPFAGDVAAAIDAIPADADAVLLGPLLRLRPAGMEELADRLIERRLPSFAIIGRDDLKYGVLMTSGGREEDEVRYARRVALNVQRILLGDDPSRIDVRIAEPQRLAINMQTAEAIGFYPRYAVLVDAEQLLADELDAGEPLSLNEAMAEAVESNLDLEVAGYEPVIAGTDRALARSQLFPQLGIGVQAVTIDEDRANPLIQSERSVDAEISGSQIVYSDDVLAGFRIAAYLEEAARYGYQVEVLDTLQSAASAYLGVLRARALERVRRSNLEVTRTNLELARLRQSIGVSGRGDVLRWESQLATDRRNLVAAEADRRVSTTAFNRILNRPKSRPFVPADEDVSRSISLFQDERFRAFIDNAAVWALFQDFSVQKTMQQAPELRRLDRVLAAKRREVLAARRKFYIPELSLGGNFRENLSRGGAGSDLTLVGIDDESWSVGLTARWPLFAGGALRAELNRQRFQFDQLERSRAALAERLETRTRIALHRASGTYPSLEFSAEAADAARENLALVTDSYRTGVVSVTDLIDAQNAALAADLDAVDARYAYLIDVVDVLRATGDFVLLADPGRTETWFQEVEAYLREHGNNVRR